MKNSKPHHQIRANYDSSTIVVYQAYNSAIADAALEAQRFVAPFSMGRATWIKPSFLWLMERSGYGTKFNQERILGVRITRSGWEDALSQAVLTEPNLGVYRDSSQWREQLDEARVIVQWDPERTLRGAKLEYRSIQVGLRRTIVEDFVNDWIVGIEDLTPLTKRLRALRSSGDYDKAKRLLPKEKVYPVSETIRSSLGMFA